MSCMRQNCEYETTVSRQFNSRYPWRRSYGFWSLAACVVLCSVLATAYPGTGGVLALNCGGKFALWQLFTAGFVAPGLFGVLISLVLLFFIGIRLENEWSRRDLIITYLLAAVGANGLLLALAPGGIYNNTAGPLCGLLGAAWYHLGHEQWCLLPSLMVKARLVIVLLAALMLLLPLVNGFLILSMSPALGFVLGLVYCRVWKIMQHQEARGHKHDKHDFSKIEFD